MARPFPLAAVRTLAQGRTEQAAGDLQGHAGRLHSAEDKLEQLRRYRDEYRAAKSTELTRGITAARMREYDSFLVRLDEAIEAQTIEVTRAQAIWEAARVQWLEARRREKAMDALAARHAAGEALREERLDRKVQDEFAARVRTSPMKIRLK